MTKAPSRGISLGRILGARVILRPSTIVMALLLAAFYAWDGTSISRQGFTIGLTVAIGLFVAVFLHELAHTAAARAFGRPVDEIVLTFFGGHTQFRSRDPKPLEVGVIAAAGPVANALIAALSLVAAAAVDGLAGTVLGYFGWMNAILAIFNALPGSPLDGGRVLQAIVWGMSGDRYKGHRAAAWGGRITAIVVVVGAIVWPYLTGRTPDIVAIVWAVLLFGVIWPAASAELRAATVLGRREQVSARSVAIPAVAVTYDQSVAEASRIAAASGAREVIVLASDGQAAGHFPVALVEAVPEEARDATTLVSVTMPLARGAEVDGALAGEELVQAVVPWLGRTDVLVVTDAGVPVGVVRTEDLRAALG